MTAADESGAPPGPAPAGGVSRPARAIETREQSPWSGKECPHCRLSLQVGHQVVVCPGDRTPQHAACWQEHNHTCAVCGYSAPIEARPPAAARPPATAPAAAAVTAGAAPVGAGPARTAARAAATGAAPRPAPVPRQPAVAPEREAPGLRTKTEVRAALEHALSGLDSAPAFSVQVDEVVVRLTPETLVEGCRRAKFHPELRFDYLRCLSGVDYMDEGMEVVYHLFSMQLLQKCTLKVRVPTKNPVLPTVTSVWAGANWHEREAMEMFGFVFEGHPHPEPLLLQKDEHNRIVPGYILRKSFPLRPKEYPAE